ncbi:MAG TPA: ribosome biogenesis GTPase Der [Acidobacteriota bacterium]|nr:ribosome biogenesis GTPase Der [Acidobacteriota bacterium]
MYRVAICGRPNVGKSTLFNRMTGSRRAIVGDEPGITRDRIIEVAEWGDRQFEVIDTGGILPEEKDLIPEKILEQASLAFGDADLLLLVVDLRAGMTPLDESLNALLRGTGKPYAVVANKADVEKLEDDALEFHALGVEQVFPVSAEHGRGIGDLLDWVVEKVPRQQAEEEPEEEIRVAIIGRPNVGKSSLLNRLVGEERVIVTDLPGTTRDAVDTRVEQQGQRYRIIDTAGIRRKGKTHEMAEKLSVVMARKSMVRSDVVLLVIDAVEGATKLDATIAGYAFEAGKSVIIVVNKWDLIDKDAHTLVSKEADFRRRLRFLDFAPMIFVSALSGQRVSKILNLVREAYQARYIRVPTAELNKLMEKVMKPHLASSGSSRKFPLKYGTQAGVAPPTFVLFTRGGKPLHFSTQRFFINQLRQAFGFYAAPIRLLERRSKPSKAARKR